MRLYPENVVRTSPKVSGEIQKVQAWEQKEYQRIMVLVFPASDLVHDDLWDPEGTKEHNHQVVHRKYFIDENQNYEGTKVVATVTLHDFIVVD